MTFDLLLHMLSDVIISHVLGVSSYRYRHEQVVCGCCSPCCSNTLEYMLLEFVQLIVRNQKQEI